MTIADRFIGKVALVTGGAQGIGQAVVERLVAEGAAVVIPDRKAEKTEALVREVRSGGGRAVAVCVDVRDDDSAEKIVKESVDAYGRVDLAVICAGICKLNDWTEITPEEWDQTLDINLRGAFLCLQAIAKQMIAQGDGGAIVNIASTSGHGPRPDGAHYGASKAGLIHLTRSLALGLAPHRIRVNGISPGVTENTGTWDMAVRGRAALQRISEEEYRQKVYSLIPLGRGAAREEVAGLTAFLLSEEASFITGQIIMQDGGYSLKVA